MRLQVANCLPHLCFKTSILNKTNTCKHCSTFQQRFLSVLRLWSAVIQHFKAQFRHCLTCEQCKNLKPCFEYEQSGKISRSKSLPLIWKCHLDSANTSWFNYFNKARKQLQKMQIFPKFLGQRRKYCRRSSFRRHWRNRKNLGL